MFYGWEKASGSAFIEVAQNALSWLQGGKNFHNTELDPSQV